MRPCFGTDVRRRARNTRSAAPLRASARPIADRVGQRRRQPPTKVGFPDACGQSAQSLRIRSNSLYGTKCTQDLTVVRLLISCQEPLECRARR